MRKTLLSFILMLLPMLASADDSGSCGDGVTFFFEEATGTLTISKTGEGTGGMTDYYFDGPSFPWSSYIKGIRYIVIEAGVTSIGYGAFYGCGNMTSVSIPKSVTSIGMNAFTECKSLMSVTIPDCVTSIEEGSFSGCSSLLSITIPDGVTSIGYYAFNGCTGLTSVTLPNSLTSIEFGAFYGCNSLFSVAIPEGVVSIGGSAFLGCSGLASVSIPNSVTSIGENAFSGCSGLNDVYLYDIAAWCKIAFSDFRSNPLSYAKHLYLNGEEIKSLTIPTSVTYINDNTFSGYSGVMSITIPESVISIGKEAFYSCSGITSVTISDGLTSIGHRAFSGCRSLHSINLPNSVTLIGNEAFSNCSSLTHVTIPDGVTSIGNATFQYCTSLTSVTIPSNVTIIGEDVFSGCSGLTSVTIPDGVTIINERTFSKCFNLINVELPKQLRIIKQSAFYNCRSLEMIKIPSTVEYIYQQAFSGCGLKSVSIEAEKPPLLADNSFSNYDIPLYVPNASMGLYQTTSPWSKFSNYVPAFPTFNLTYMVDGEPYKTYKYEANIAIPAEPAPEKEGYTFSGWSEIPETMPDHDVEVTGTFTVNKYNLIYMVDGEEYKTVEFEYGAEITPEDGPEKEGYTFKGWNEIPETMPANDVTVTGIYEKNLLGKCATPTIAYANDELTFSSETEDVEFVYDIKVNGSASGTGNKVKVATTLTVNVYAKKEGYENSDVATKEIQPKFGDLSGDGEVDATDLTKLIDILLGR